MSPPQALAAVIGDVVGSRSAGPPPRLHARLVEALDQVNATMTPSVPFRITVGDEYQGCFDGLGDALAASLHLRLRGLPDVDLRHGIGWGAVAVLADEPRVEDGPGWWAAREAIDGVKAEAARAGLRHARTAYRCAEGEPGPPEGPVNAALLLRDHLLGTLSDRSLGVLRGLLGGMTQRDIAEAEGVSASAVSQRVRTDGLTALVAAEQLLRTVT